MKIDILTFGIAREICGGRLIQIDVEAGTDTDGLRLLLAERYPALSGLAQLNIAVNSEYVTEPVTLHPGDEIAIIPPVSGG
jgi:molybdopterin synthase sulfur carrier subunit